MAKKAAPKDTTKESPPTLAEPGGNVLSGIPEYVKRIEQLEEERRELGKDIRDIYDESESAGVDKKVLRMLVSKRRKDAEEQKQLERLLKLYEEALGG